MAVRPAVLTVGDNVVDVYPDLGVMYPGGNMVNVAVHGRRLGALTGYIGAVGTDQAGSVVRHALAAEGVDLARLRVVDGANATATVRLVDGNRHFAGGDAGVSRFRLTEADLTRVAEADLVHTGECSFIEDQLADLASAARRISFDFSERPWAYIARYAPLVDVAIVSLPGSAADAAEQTALRLLSLGPSVAAVTLGPAGAVLAADGAVVRAPAAPVTVIDTLGAGDAFIARLLLGILRSEQPAALVNAATSYASASCASHGAFGYATDLSRATRSLDPGTRVPADIAQSLSEELA